MPAERINTRLKNFKSQSFSRKAHEQAVCGEAETSEGFFGAILREGYISHRKRNMPTEKNIKDARNRDA